MNQEVQVQVLVHHVKQLTHDLHTHSAVIKYNVNKIYSDTNAPSLVLTKAFQYCSSL